MIFFTILLFYMVPFKLVSQNNVLFTRSIIVRVCVRSCFATKREHNVIGTLSEIWKNGFYFNYLKFHDFV